MAMTTEQKELIADIAEQIVDLGLLEEATTTKDKEAFEEAMFERMAEEIRQAEIDAGIQRKDAHLGPAMDKVRIRIESQITILRQTLCENCELKEKYRHWINLGFGGMGGLGFLKELLEVIVVSMKDQYPGLGDSYTYVLYGYMGLVMVERRLDKFCLEA